MWATGERAALAIAIVAMTVLLTAGSAAATTFCVPSFHAACPNSGGNVAEADVEKAMTLNGKDGVADRVSIAAGTFIETGAYEPEPGFTSADTFEPTGSDPLTIEGSGPATVLTSNGTGNIFLVNFASNNTRAIVVRDLTARVPAGFDDGLGAAFQLSGDKLERVDIVSRNPGSDAIGSATGKGNLFRDGELRGEAGGSIGDGLGVTGTGAELLVEDATILGSSWALRSTGKGAQLTARRVRVVDAGAYGVAVTAGMATIENSTFTVDDGIGLYASAAADPAVLNADHVTVVSTSGSYPAVEAKKFSASAGSVSLNVSSSILRGFGSGYKADTPFGPGVGTVSISIRHSNLPAAGVNLNGNVDVATGNVDLDPMLAADLSLPPGSPAIDVGDPAAVGLAADFLGAPRPVDGDGDGVSRRDMGAYEYQPPPVPSGEPTPDATPPWARIVAGPGKKLAKGVAGFRFVSSEAGSTFRCKLDGKPARGCRSPRTYRRLKPGRHVFRVWAVDAAGNVSPKPAKRRFRVPKP